MNVKMNLRWVNAEKRSLMSFGGCGRRKFGFGGGSRSATKDTADSTSITRVTARMVHAKPIRGMSCCIIRGNITPPTLVPAAVIPRIAPDRL